MLGGVSSRLDHARVPESNVSLRYPRGVKCLLVPHANCVSGDGHRRESCARRKQLIEIAVSHDWNWVYEVPGVEPPQRDKFSETLHTLRADLAKGV